MDRFGAKREKRRERCANSKDWFDARRQESCDLKNLSNRRSLFLF
jgi:hypothetical protein